MNIERFINSSKQYQDWEINHPNVSYSLKDYAYNVSKSQEFQNWLSANPNGTLDHYMAILQQHRQTLLNSPEYQVSLLKSQVEEQEQIILELNNQIEKLNTEISDKMDDIETLQNTIIVWESLTFILPLISLALGYTLSKKSRFRLRKVK